MSIALVGLTMSPLSVVSILLSYFLLNLISIGALNENLFIYNETANCTCPGDTLTYICTVMNFGITVWSGTLIDNNCQDNEISFFHLAADFDKQSENCSNGAIVARTQSMEDNTTFTSMLTVLVSGNFNNQTVECVHDGNQDIETQIGMSTITIASAGKRTLGVRVSDVSRGQLTLSWNSLHPVCPSSAIRYEIITDNFNCGNCTLPSLGQNSANCSATPSALSVLCTLTLQLFVCGSFNPTSNDSVNVILKVPDAPVVEYLPTYSVDNERLMSISLSIKKEEYFNIAEDIKATILFYNISFFESSTNNLCHSILYTTSELSCVEDYICSVEIDLVTLRCSLSASLSFAVFATNQLGDGPETPTVILEPKNNFVTVTYDPSTTTLTCNFLTDVENVKGCSVCYGQSSQNFMCTVQKNSTSSIIALKLHSVDEGDLDFFYIITATNGSYTVKINGTLNLMNHTSMADSQRSVVKIVLGVMLTIVVIMVTVSTVAVLIRLKQLNYCKESTAAALESQPSTDERISKECIEVLPLDSISGQSADNTAAVENPPTSTEFDDLSQESIKNIESVSIQSNLDSIPIASTSAIPSQFPSSHDFQVDTVLSSTVELETVEIGREEAIAETTESNQAEAADKIGALESESHTTGTEHSLSSLTTVECNSATFKVLNVNEACELEEFISQKNQLKFERGCAYYEFTHHEENITDKQEVILFNKETGEFLTGKEALSMIDAPGVAVQRPQKECLIKYQVFVQSIGSGGRHVDANSIVLFKECPDSVVLKEMVKLAEDKFMSVHPDIYKMYPLQYDCKFESFCCFKKLNPIKTKVYVEQIKISNYGEIQDAVVIDKESGRYFTGHGAKKLALELKTLIKDHRSSSLPNPANRVEKNDTEENSKMDQLTQKWLVLISCKFSKDMFLTKGTHILYLNSAPTITTLENICKLTINKDCIQLSQFVKEHLGNSFQDHNIFYEFTRDREDIFGDTEVILMHKDSMVFTRLIGNEVSKKIPGAPGVGIKRPSLENHNIFIQCRSQWSRCLRKDTLLLYRIDDGIIT